MIQCSHEEFKLKNLLNEKCAFCEKDGNYFDFINGQVTSVCQKHLRMEASS